MIRLNRFITSEYPKEIFQELPFETCLRVLFYLNDRDAQSLRCVNYYFGKKIAIIRKNCEEFLKLQDAAKILGLSQEISYVESDLLLQGSVDLKGIKLSAQSLRGNVLNALKKISIEDQFELTVKYPTLHILDHYRRIRQKIGLVLGMPDNEEKWLALADKCLWLIEEGLMEDAMRVADPMPDVSQKWDVFESMAVHYVKEGLFLQAFDVMAKVPDANRRMVVIYVMVNELYSTRQIDEAMKTIDGLPSNADKNHILQCISNIWAKNNNPEKALAALKMMEDAMPKWIALRNLCSLYAKQSNISDVLSLAPLIIDNLYRESVVLPIAYDLIDRRDMENALMVINLLPDGEGKWRAFQKMAVVHVRDNEMTEAEQSAKRISNIVIRENTLLDIVLAWLKSGNLDAAERVSGMMIEGERKWTAIQYICSSTVVVHGIEKSLQISKQIPDGYFKEQALACMASALSRTGKREDAEKILDLLPEGQLKQRTIQEICSIYVEKDDTVSLLATIKLIPDAKNQKTLVRPMVRRLSREGKFNKVEMVLDLMPNDGAKWKVFRHFSLNDLANACKWVQKIGDEKIQEMACKDIITELLQKDQLDRTQEILNMMTDGYSKWIACHNVCLAWMKKDLEKAKEIANLISDPIMRERAYKYMGLIDSIDV